MPATQECLRNLDIEIPAGEVEREFSRIAQSWQRRARIAGFRPGKAPLTLVRQRYGGQIRDELLQTLLPAHLRAAFERERLEPVSTPTVEDLHFHSGEPIRFKTSFEVVPEFELGDYKSLRVEMPAPEVADSEVDDQIRRLRERHARYEPIADGDAAVAADGMVATLSSRRRESRPPAAGASGDGEAAGSGDSEDEPVDELRIPIGNADTLPEFSQALRGMHIGETRAFPVAYPEDYAVRRLAGRTFTYTATLQRLEREILPELTPEFLQEVAGADSEAGLRERVRESLLDRRRHELQHRAEDALMEQLADMHDFPAPQALVDRQVDRMLERRLEALALNGIDPRRLQLDWQKMRAAQEPAARKQVRGLLVLERIAARENIAAPEAEVEAEVAALARRNDRPLDATRRRLTENGGLDTIKTRVRNEHTLAFLLTQAAGSPSGRPQDGGSA